VLRFHQARKDPTQQPVASLKLKRPHDDHVEVFEDATTSQMRHDLIERLDFPERKVGESVSEDVFAVLDAQSVQDHTIAIHVNHGDYDELTDSFVRSQWYTWRVKFSGVDKLLTPFVIDPWEVIEDVLLKREAFVGVFDVEMAVNDWINRPQNGARDTGIVDESSAKL
jgi:hypothetical protein